MRVLGYFFNAIAEFAGAPGKIVFGFLAFSFWVLMTIVFLAVLVRSL